MPTSDNYLRHIAYEQAQMMRGQKKELPVPVEAIAKNEGAELKFVPMKSEGALTRTDTGYTMYVRSEASATRQRFTIGHELGHIALDKIVGSKTDVSFRLTDITHSNKLEERFCDYFASYLLIPDEAIIDFNDWSNISIDRMLKHGNELGVSAEAIARRVVEFAPMTGGLLFFRFMSKPNDRQNVKLRLHYGIFPGECLYLPRYDSLPDNSSLHQVFNCFDERLILNTPLNCGGLKGKRNVLTRRIGTSLMVIVLPSEIDPEHIPIPRFKCWQPNM